MGVVGKVSGAGVKSALLASASLIALAASAGVATAGGFAIREQSTNFQGMSFAGEAAGGAISSMFWNSAAAASKDGTNTESAYTVIFPESDITVTSITPANPALGQALAGLPGGTDSGDIGRTGFVGASYGNYQLSKDVFLGMAVNAPFGLKTDPSSTYFGAYIAQKTELVTYNFNPTIAVRLSSWLTVGAGVQIQSADGALRFRTPVPIPNVGVLDTTTIVEGNGWGFGGTAGVLIKPTRTTEIGIGYRSQIDQDINGHMETYGTPLTQPTEVTLKLPDVVTFSIREAVSPVFRVAGTFEWTNWSRFDSLAVTAAANGANIVHPTGSAAGSQIAALPFNWTDGYFLSGGAEYDYSKVLTLRAGVGYEWSPVDSPEKRTTAFPDANRVWLSGGFSYQVFKTTTVDFAYTHLFVEDASFLRSNPTGQITVAGDVSSSVDIVSVGMKTRW
jgi:long-chain fatty acid transport protein